MIALNLIAEGIKKKLGSFYSTDAHSTTDIIRYINSAARYLVIAKNFPFNKYSYSLTTNSGTTEYSIPYQIETFFILDESGNKIDLYSFESYFQLTDKTNKICILEDKLYTTVTGKLTIYYRGFITLVTSLEGNIDIPEHFLDLMILLGSYYGFLDVKAFNKANEVKGISDGFIGNLATRQSNKLPLQTKRLNTSTTNIW